ncbi:MAG: CIS tube protein [Chitinophagales bacterium]
MLTKLKILGYKDEKCKAFVGEFKALINPSEYSHAHSIKTENRKDLKMPTNDSYDSTNPETVDFTLIFDGTGAIPGTAKKTVFDNIDKLKDICYYYNGTVHRPNYLKLQWGNNFKRTKKGAKYFTCQLKTLNISYKLFAPDGSPLRAEAKLSFSEFRDAKIIDKEAQTSSPDLTHIRLVRQGDRLPLMCYEIYNDSSVYLQVAKVNNITNFRKIQPGQQIFFPPLV